MARKYSSLLRINLANLSDTLKLLDGGEGAFDRVAIFSQSTHSVRGLDYHRRTASAASRGLLELRKRGVFAGVNIMVSLGFFTEAPDMDTYELDFSLSPYTGETLVGKLCPESAKNREYLKEVYRIWASIGPDFIYVDDDMSMIECVCPRCRARFSQLYPDRDFAGSDIESRRLVLEYSSRRTQEIYSLIEKTVHAVSPEIMLGGMTYLSHTHLLEPDMHALALLGGSKNGLLWRPGGGVYTDESMHAVMKKAYTITQQVSSLTSDVTSIESEIECFPHHSLEKSASFVAYESFIYQAAGCSGTTYNILSADTGIFSGHKKHFALAKKTREYATMLTGAFADAPIRGACFYYPREVAAYAQRNVHEHFDSLFAADMHAVGIPYAESVKYASVVLFNEASARMISDGELLTALKGGVYMDVPALRVINERGYGEYTGFKVGECYTENSLEMHIKHPLNPRTGASRNIRQAFMQSDREAYTVIATKEDAKYLSEHLDLYGTRRGMGSGYYENSLGGRVFVEGMTPYRKCAYNQTDNERLKRIMRLLAGTSRFAFVSSFHKALLYDRGALFVANESTEDACGLTVDVRTDRKYASVNVTRGADMFAAYTVKTEELKDGYRRVKIPTLPVYGTALIVLN